MCDGLHMANAQPGPENLHSTFCNIQPVVTISFQGSICQLVTVHNNIKLKSVTKEIAQSPFQEPEQGRKKQKQ